VLGVVTAETGQQGHAGIERALVEALVEVRSRMRTGGHYDAADAIRDRLDELGVELKDGAEGTTWRFR